MSSPILDVLFPRTRRRLLGLLLVDPNRWWYMRELALHLGLPSSSLQRELASLTSAGILRRKVEGRQVYFRPNAECIVLQELRNILDKTGGLGRPLGPAAFNQRRSGKRIVMNAIKKPLAFARTDEETMCGLAYAGNPEAAERWESLDLAMRRRLVESASNLDGAILIGWNMSSLRIKASLRGARLDNADFTLAELSGTDLTGASCRGTKFLAADVNGCDFTDADLQCALFTGPRTNTRPTIVRSLKGTRFEHGARPSFMTSDG